MDSSYTTNPTILPLLNQICANNIFMDELKDFTGDACQAQLGLVPTLLKSFGNKLSLQKLYIIHLQALTNVWDTFQSKYR